MLEYIIIQNNVLKGCIYLSEKLHKRTTLLISMAALILSLFNSYTNYKTQKKITITENIIKESYVADLLQDLTIEDKESLIGIRTSKQTQDTNTDKLRILINKDNKSFPAITSFVVWLPMIVVFGLMFYDEMKDNL